MKKSFGIIFSHLMSIILHYRGSVKDKLFYNMKYTLFFSAFVSKEPETERVKKTRSLRQKTNIGERHLGHLHPSLHRTDHFARSLLTDR